MTAPDTDTLIALAREGRIAVVKPLEWRPSTWKGTVVFRAKSVVGEYIVAPKVFDGGWLWRLDDVHWDETYFSAADEDEAKAAAQADYEQRILSALSLDVLALAEERDRLREALDECEDYFDNRADADCDQDGFIPNKEMRLLSVVRAALAITGDAP